MSGTIYSKHYNARATSQSEPIPGSTQVKNSGGGFSFKVDDWTRLDRFLILGSEGGTYYASERKLTVENAEATLRCLKLDGARTVNRVVEISEAGRAPKNDPALFVLAMAAGLGGDSTKKSALSVISRVARISTHLFTFIENVQGFRGWGRGLRRSVGNWYNDKDINDLAYQVVKYRQRNGWSHRDVLRLSSPTPTSDSHNALYRWVVAPDRLESRTILRRPTKSAPVKATNYEAVNKALLPHIIEAFESIQNSESADDAARILRDNPKLSWEMVPTNFLGDRDVWGALLPNLPMTALIRNLVRMTANGLVAEMSDAAKNIVARLSDQEAIRKSRLHPASILSALVTYESGRGQKGSLMWTPVGGVIDALNEAFYLSFGNVTPTNKRVVLALDVSSSMESGTIAGMGGLTPRVGSAAMALVTANTEPNHSIIAFSDTMVPVNITKKQRIDDVVKMVRNLSFGGTDCAQPMIWAMNGGIDADIFVIYTDSETWVGRIHPAQALKEYRDKTGIPAKLVVVGMVSNEFSIADPDDGGMMDVCGFDIATPQLISDFMTE